MTKVQHLLSSCWKLESYDFEERKKESKEGQTDIRNADFVTFLASSVCHNTLDCDWILIVLFKNKEKN